MAATSAEEEATIAALLGAIAPQAHLGVQQLPLQPPMPSLEPRESVADARDVLVLDAALGQGFWRLNIERQDVDFTEARADGTWAASVSLVLSLSRVLPSTSNSTKETLSFMHDEVGSGHAQGLQDEESATRTAKRVAFSSARRRLAKRFAHSLDPHLLAEIERRANPAMSKRHGGTASLMQQFGGGKKPKR